MRRRGALALSAECVAVAALTLVCVTWVLQLWRADLTAPLRYTPVDDTKFYLMLAKGIVDHGWYLTNSSLGAPFGQQLFDYPQGADNLSLVMIRGFALFSSDPALIVNLFLLLTFALVSTTCHLVLRHLGVTRAVAAVVSILFALLPYHFFRGESHLLLSAYYAVPLAALLFLDLLAGTSMFTHRAPPSRRMLRWCSPRSLGTLGLCIVIGSANLYYATFALVLIVGATAINAVVRRTRAALDGTLIALVIVGTLAVNLSPSFVYRIEHGSDSAVTRSAVADETTTEAFALRLTNLVLPVPDSRIGPLRRIAARYDHAIAPGYCEACYAGLGAVGTVGLVWLAVCALGTLLGAANWFAAQRLFRHAGIGVGLAFAAGTVGGLSSVFEFFVTPDIRAWNRISVFIAFLCLLAVALLLDTAVARLRSQRGGAALAGLLLAGVLAVGVLDQTTTADVPGYAASARQWHSDSVFVDKIQARLPSGASIFQLPYVPFPEGYPNTPVGDQVAAYATKYEPLRGYLHSTALRWSYGAMKGRPADWAAQLAGQPLGFVLPAVTAAGFDGVWLDPAGFEPPTARRVLASVRALLAVAPLQSPERDLYFFDLRPYRQRLLRFHSPAQLALLRAATLDPLRSSCAAHGLTLVDPLAADRAATLIARLVTGTTITRRLVLAPGQTSVRLPAAVRSATITDAAVAPFELAARGPAGSLVVGLTGPRCPG